MEFIFWFFLLLLVYVYIGYPFILAILFFYKTNAISKNSDVPFISVVLSVYNEEKVISSKIRNFRNSDYPPTKSEFIIVSDGSTDHTNQIVQEETDERIKFIIQSDRMGKTSALNLGVSKAKGDILVFTDANTMFERDTLKNLAKDFKDLRVGCVSGFVRYVRTSSWEKGPVEVGGVYSNFEKWIKVLESQAGGIIGADGALYGLRRDIFTYLESKMINDFIHPIQTVLNGYKAILDPEVIGFEEATGNFNQEYHRQIRMVTQAFLIFFLYFPLLIKKRKLLYAFQFISHKFLRWFTAPMMIIIYVLSALLITSGEVYRNLFIFQGIFYGCVFIGFLSEKNLLGKLPSILKFPYYFFFGNWAALVGFYKFLRGEVQITWKVQGNPSR